MLDNGILSFESPWAAVLEAAQGGPDILPRTAQRGLLTERELTALTGSPAPVLLLSADGAPPALADSNAPNPERGAFFRQMAEARGWPVMDFFNWNMVGSLPFSQMSWYTIPFDHPEAPKLLRRDPSAGDEYNFTAPLRHRLGGDSIPIFALIILSERNAVVVNRHSNPADSLLCSQLHEMFHALQLSESKPRDNLLHKVQRERDADQGAVIAFQTAFGGGREAAAREILTRALGVFGSTEQYYFWPEFKEDQLLHGPFFVYGLVVAASFARAGLSLPDQELTKHWSLLAAGFMPLDIYEANKAALDNVTAVVYEQREDARIRGIFEGIALLRERRDPVLTGKLGEFASNLWETARVMKSPYLPAAFT